MKLVYEILNAAFVALAILYFISQFPFPPAKIVYAGY